MKEIFPKSQNCITDAKVLPVAALADTADSLQHTHADLCAVAVPGSTGMAAPVYNAAAGRTNNALLMKCNEAKGIQVALDQHNVVGRHKLAVICQEVRDGSQYGTGSVKKLADFLALNPSTVHDYANVATFWPDEQQFKNAVMCEGKSLSWSHVMELTREQDSDRRQSLMAQALNDGWSVKRLKKERKASTVEEDDPDVAPSRPSHNLGDVAEGFSTQLAALKSTWEEDLPRQIKKTDPIELPAALDKLLQARRDWDTVYHAGTKALDLCIVQVEERLKLESHKVVVDQQQA